MPKIKKDKAFEKFFGVTGDKVHIIILALTFLSLVLVELMIAVYQNTVLPIPKWVNLINTLPFGLVILLLAYLFMFLEHGYFWRIFIFLIFLITIFNLTMNFGFLFPRYYALYQFSCNVKNHPS